MPEPLDIKELLRLGPDDGDGPDVEDAADAKDDYRKILTKIQDREKAFESGWWKDAEVAIKLYDGGSTSQDDQDKAYNILYSNTEVLLPSLYSATPKPDVRTRYIEQNLGPIPKAVERFLTIISDPANPGIESLDDAMSETVLSSLVAGAGFCRLRYYPDRAMPVAIESGHYKGLIWAKGRKWPKLPWIAFRHELSKEEVFAQFKIPEEEQSKFSQSDKDYDSDTKAAVGSKPYGTVVYEYLDKASRKTCFLCEDWEDLILREDEDVLKLEGFYPTPGLMLMTKQPGEVEPVTLFQYYRNQAQELNRITVRLNKIISAIRVRGAYNGLLGDDMQKLLADSEMENALIPASEAAMLASQGGGFERHIWMLPIEKLILVGTQLFQAREAIKTVIYELTGLSDIIRGSSVASETATAQDLKNKWGTIRLRKMQAIVSNYVRDLYRLSVDAATTVIPAEGWKEITQMPLPLAAEQAAARQQLQYMQMQQAQMGPQQASQPPPPQLLAAAQGPNWEEVIAKISSDANRAFLINVQTSSTIDLDTAADKSDVTEFMSALGQILPGLGEFVSLGPSGLTAAKAILVGICSRYKFGLEMIPALNGIEAPAQEQGPDPEQQKQLQEAQQELEQQKLQLQQQNEANTKQLQQIQAQMFQLKEQGLALEKQAAEVRSGIREFEASTKIEQISRSADIKVLNANKELAQAKLQAQALQVQVQPDPAAEAELERYKAELSAATSVMVAQIGAEKAETAAQEAAEPAYTQNPNETHANDMAETQRRTMEIIQSLVVQLSRPKTIIRDAEGRAQGIQ
jgi:hypothetical protein